MPCNVSKAALLASKYSIVCCMQNTYWQWMPMKDRIYFKHHT